MASILLITTRSSSKQTRHTPASVPLHTPQCIQFACVTQHHTCRPTVSARRAGCVINGKNHRPQQAEAPQKGCESGSVTEQAHRFTDTCTGCPVAEVATSARVQCGCVLCVLAECREMIGHTFISSFFVHETKAKQSKAKQSKQSNGWRTSWSNKRAGYRRVSALSLLRWRIQSGCSSTGAGGLQWARLHRSRLCRRIAWSC